MLNLMHTNLFSFDFKVIGIDYGCIFHDLNFDHVSAYFMFHALDCSMHLLGTIAILLGVYKLCILAVGDCYTDLSTILIFVCKNRIVLAEFQHIDGSARWLKSFNYNHTPHTCTLPSIGHC